MKKQDLLKKGSSIALVATIVGSQLLTSVPYNVFAAEDPATTSAETPYYGEVVSTWAELKAAMTSSLVTDVYLDADITMEETLKVPATTKRLHGNNHTLNANLKEIELTTDNTVGLVENLKITNTDIYGLFWSNNPGVTVTYKDVDHNGHQMIYLPSGELIIEGTVTSNSTKEEVFQGKQLTIKDNAKVDFVSSETTPSIAPITFIGANGGLFVGKNANLKVRSNAVAIYGGNNYTLINHGNMDLKSELNQAIHLNLRSTMYFKTGSVLKAVSGDKVEEAVEATAGSIFVEPGATFEVESNGTQAAVITGDTFKLAQGSNYSITNFNAGGTALGAYNANTNVILQSDKGVSTWDRGTVTNATPTATYPGIFDAQFTLNTYTTAVKQTNFTSNNTQFTNAYSTAKTGKITGGSFSLSVQDEARTIVNELFTDSTKTIIKTTTTQTTIDAAQTIVNKVTDVTVKAELQKDIDNAQSLLNAKNEQVKQTTASTAVKELFTNNDPSSNSIKTTTNQKAIDDAQKTIDVLAPGSVKDGLQADLDKAQNLLDASKAQAAADQSQKAVASYAVNQLFVNNTPASDAIKASTDQDAIDNAQAEINKIKDPALKVDLQKDLDRAQELLDARNAATATEQAKQDAARKAVNELFNNNTPSSNAIKPATNQAAIDAAQALVNKVTDPTTKAALQADVDKAQSLLDAKNAATAAEQAKQDAAKKAVDELFNNNTPSSNAIKPVTDQAAIDAAQALVNKVTDPTTKAALQQNVDKAQSLLDAKNATATEKAKQDAARTAVNELFNNNTPSSNAIKPATNQAAIDAAQALVNKVTDPTVKAALQADVNKAQSLLDAKNTALTKAVLDAYHVTDGYVTGKVDANTATVELYINGVRSKISTPTNGEFKLYAQGFGLKIGDTFEVRPVDANGNKGPAVTGTVLGAALNLTTNDAGVSAPTVTGTVGAGITSVRLSIDGTIVKVGQINADGTYSIATNGLVKPGSKVEVVGYVDKTEMARKAVNIVNDEKPVLKALTIDDDVVKGSVTAGSATSVRISINGVQKKTATIAADGTFESNIGKQALGTVVTIEVKESTGNYNSYRTASVTVTESAVAKLAAPTLTKMDGGYIVGTAPKGTETIVIYEDGAAARTQNVSAMTVNPDGSFTFKAYVAASASKVQVQAKNSDKRMNSDLSAAFTK
ncbi:toxin Cry1Ac domain D-VI-related protein [Listeria booriae]|uniref:toxin Cry1Ac domain D-VI-related protein n=1 Tax=Listeria booriae TaxID=1552123 RepID=UPI002880BC7F|nr:toxin Cry1Ac domain D-VI-related protein [Listeria booriae]MDT0111512.1 toxin Cry1Ac domain D-VI-related protein [Listeria booriae]